MSYPLSRADREREHKVTNQRLEHNNGHGALGLIRKSPLKFEAEVQVQASTTQALL